jgi:SRSO17 transposase
MRHILQVADVVTEIDARPPVMNLAPHDIEDLLQELHQYHQQFSPLFQRPEQRHWCLLYLEGLLSQCERKAVEPMADRLVGGNVRAMQQFVGDGAWADTAILDEHQKNVAVDLGEADGVLVVDESGFPKQGEHSVGVKRQYCGSLGKIANCQVGVFVAYASRKGYTFLDRRLYMPEEWYTEAYAEKRQRCSVPKGLSFQTKPELAWAMLQPILTERRLPCRWLTCDEVYGRDPVFLDQIDQAGVWYFAEVPSDTRVWREAPVTYVPAPTSSHGRPPSKKRLLPGSPEPESVAMISAALTADRWRPYLVKEGSKGPMVCDFAFVRVIEVRDGLPGQERWLVLRRSL